MEKLDRFKPKNKKSAPKPAKKRKNDGPTCSMFLAEITRKLAAKRRQIEEAPKNIVQTIIDSLTNALPIRFSRKSPPKKDSPIGIETLQSFAPELIPNDTINILPSTIDDNDDEYIDLVEKSVPKTSLKMPRMPIVNSEVIKQAAELSRRSTPMQDEAVNTAVEHDVASEIAKHVGTLRKISLIAEEFNQKTAKNLKEIVDSVQEDLLKKLAEIKAEQKLANPKPLSIEEKKDLIE